MNKVALITGSNGIGLGIAKVFAENGYDLVYQWFWGKPRNI